MTEAFAKHHVSEAEYFQLPETTQRMELVDGEVLVSPSASVFHQVLVGRIYLALQRWAERRDVTVFVSPLDVRFAPNRILQPDVFVCLNQLPLKQVGPLTYIPELCVEVVSTNRTYDRIAKRLMYAEAGVQEYWVVEQNGEVERYSGERLSAKEVVSEVLTSTLLAGFELRLSELFAAE